MIDSKSFYCDIDWRLKCIIISASPYDLIYTIKKKQIIVKRGKIIKVLNHKLCLVKKIVIIDEKRIGKVQLGALGNTKITSQYFSQRNNEKYKGIQSLIGFLIWILSFILCYYKGITKKNVKTSIVKVLNRKRPRHYR